MVELAEITDRVKAAVGNDSGLDAVVKFVFPESGCLLIDGRSVPNRVSNDDGASDITITLKLDNLEKILDQKLNPKIALMTGRMRLRGDIRIAMRLDKVFGLPPSMA